MTMTTYTPQQLTAIARECAAFAWDNYDRADTDGTNYTLAPAAIWQGWHAKDGVEEPPMAESFVAEYLYECERTGGADFTDDIRAIEC